MPTLVATAGATNANSYCTVAQADAYHDTHLYATTWTDADDDQKTIGLIWATRLLDQHIAWSGNKYTAAQALRWPRSGVYDPDGYVFPVDEIPTFLKNATAELARHLIKEDRTADRGYGLSSLTADVITLNFDTQDEKPTLPEAVMAFIRDYGTVGGGNSGYVLLERV